MTLDALAIFVRWVHVITACVVIGSVFFLHFILPIGMRGLEPQASEAVFLRFRRRMKMVIHVGVLLFILSGAYNAYRAWHLYSRDPAVLHAIFGIHLLLALTAIALLMVAFAGREPRRIQPGLIRWALVAMILAVAAASTLKAGREWIMVNPRQQELRR
jgi:uncharacterized membrane protein